MDELNSLYIQMLHFGLHLLQHAVLLEDSEWSKAEVELLHNIPSLINETNDFRHIYQWDTTRAMYIEAVSKTQRELPRSRMKIIYQPLWNEMEPIIEKMKAKLPG